MVGDDDIRALRWQIGEAAYPDGGDQPKQQGDDPAQYEVSQ
jgi:hypothetical protein